MKDKDGGEDFAALLEEFDKKGAGRGRRRAPEVGQLVRGRVISVGREAVFVAISDGTAESAAGSSQWEGVLELAELLDQDGNVSVKEGDMVEARVVEVGDKSDQVVLRRLLRAGPQARSELQSAFEMGVPVEGTVSGVNKGGVDVTVAGVRGFCPVSQLELRGVEDPGAYVGRKLNFKITRYEVDRRGMNLVLSRRALLEAEAEVLRVETRGKLVVGAVLPGVVTAVREFGAFVDLGGLEGLLPASELGFARGQRPGDLLTVGQKLEVQVLDIRREEAAEEPGRPAVPSRPIAGSTRQAESGRAVGGGRPRRGERITLSLKALERDPWEEVAVKFPPGSKVLGKVTNVESFGAFVELAPGIEGLVHIGELSGGRAVRHARELVKVGEQREVTVVSIDRERRRISLGVGDGHERVDPEDLARAAAPGKLGTLADLFKNRKP